MATLAIQTIVRAGVKPLPVAAGGGGDNFINTGVEFIHVKNGDGSSHTVTIATPTTVDGLAVAERAVAVPAGEERLIGPFPTGIYNDDNAKVQLTYDGVTSVTISVINPGN